MTMKGFSTREASLILLYKPNNTVRFGIRPKTPYRHCSRLLKVVVWGFWQVGMDQLGVPWVIDIKDKAPFLSFPHTNHYF